MVLNRVNLKKHKEDIMKCLKLTEEQFTELRKAILKDSYKNYHTPGDHISFAIDEYLEKINKIIRTHGVESMYPDLPQYHYCNIGDPYTRTIVMNSNTKKVMLTCWGDILEKQAYYKNT
jgi:hypothetical protein